MKRIILATGNEHKVEEFAALLEGRDLLVESASVCGGMPEVDESGGTFEANAQLKAEALLEQVPEGAYVLSDDSGLEVDALDGAPGVYSARYAGDGATDSENVEKLLGAIDGLEASERSARFRCVLCLISPQGEVRFFSGACEGRIATEVTGEQGFGYDPVFIPEGYAQSFGELGDSVKSILSHRARAVEKLGRDL